MKNYYKIFIALLFIIFSCQKDKYVQSEQSEKDEEKLINFFKTKFLSGEDIINSKNPTDTITYKKISQGIYYVILEEGEGISPISDDIVYINYKGFILDTQKEFDSGDNYKLGLREGTINGLRSFITRLKTKKDNGKNGKGYVFMSSTQAFGNFENNRVKVPLQKNTCIYYKVELLDIYL